MNIQEAVVVCVVAVTCATCYGWKVYVEAKYGPSRRPSGKGCSHDD